MKKKILIVDDELAIRMLYKEELEEEGYDVEVAQNAVEAYNKFDTFKPDLVVLDIKMPDVNGLEALQKFKQKNMNIPVILCSAYSDFKSEFISWAADDYIVKSSDLKEFKEKIKKFM